MSDPAHARAWGSVSRVTAPQDHLAFYRQWFADSYGPYELENGRIKHLRVYVGHRRALDAARNGA